MQRVVCGVPNLLEPDPFSTWSSYHFQPRCSVTICYGKKINKDFSSYTPNMDITYCKIICNLYCSHSFLPTLQFGFIKTWRLPTPKISRPLLQLVLKDEQLCAVLTCLACLLVLSEIVIQQIFIKHTCVSDMMLGMG